MKWLLSVLIAFSPAVLAQQKSGGIQEGRISPKEAVERNEKQEESASRGGSRVNKNKREGGNDTDRGMRGKDDRPQHDAGSAPNRSDSHRRLDR